ncbi:MAG: NAD(P)-dependent oxidoreductase [Elainellaceae cyanobacterium]
MTGSGNFPTIGFIGTGLMGLPMAQRLIKHDISVVAYNRTAEKLDPLKSDGATIAESVADLLQQAPVVLLMLTNAEAIRDTILSEAAGAKLAGHTVIQMSTIAPSESRELQKQVNALGGEYLEAPVLGSIPQVEAGSLQVMLGGTPEQFQQWQSLLQYFGTVQRIGEVGAASALKLALNQLIGALTTAFALSVGFVQRQGGDVETFMRILRESALYAPTFDKKLDRMLDRNFADPNFPTKHLLKDMTLFLQEASKVGLQVDSLEGVRKILEAACDAGLADADYSALFAAVSPES